MKRRVFILVLDSLGVGALPDAHHAGEENCHTLNHIISLAGGLNAPRLQAWGLGNMDTVEGLEPAIQPIAAYGRLAEVSPGKDTPTGHWEMMGCPLDFAFPVYEEGFPEDFLADFVKAALPKVTLEKSDYKQVPHVSTYKDDDYPISVPRPSAFFTNQGD